MNLKCLDDLLTILKDFLRCKNEDILEDGLKIGLTACLLRTFLLYDLIYIRKKEN